MKLDDIYKAVTEKYKRDRKMMTICMAVAIGAGICVASVILLVVKTGRKIEKAVDEAEAEVSAASDD